MDNFGGDHAKNSCSLLTCYLLRKKRVCQERNPARRPGGFEIRRKKKVRPIKPGIYNPPT